MIRLSDIFLSGLLLILTLPLFILIALLLCCTGGPRIFYIMQRCGKGGKPYTHYKFRTMRAGRECGRVFFEQDRITRVGRLLRSTHLDELPELWLILIGKMSFTGPRPLPKKLLQGLDCSVRERVRPGWTGPAQLYLLRKGRLDKRLQLRLDNRYVNNRRFFYHWKLILATLLAMFCKKERTNFDPKATADRRTFREGLDTYPDDR